ncbi:hypothetical protein B0T41_11140 [Chromobacterium violaceum]|nr:hypothetical protein B0T41_11140 [Chromobacterium violaceum]
MSPATMVPALLALALTACASTASSSATPTSCPAPSPYLLELPPKPPAPDLLAHAADYGAWCQQLEQRLVALKQLYSQQEPTP